MSGEVMEVRDAAASYALQAEQDVPAGYKRTEIGVIPEDWEVRELRYFNPFITSGSRGWAKYYSDNGDLFVRITNLSRSSIYLDLSNRRYVVIPSGKNSEGLRTQLQNGDLLISITADIGIIGYVDHSIPKPAYINQHISLVRFSSADVDPLYLAYFLASGPSQKKLQALTDQGAKAGLNLNGVGKIEAAFPRPEEQRAIATALSDVDALITALDRLIAKKRAIKTAAMQQLLTGKTRLPGFTGEWETKRLGELAEIVSGGTPKSSVPEYWDGGIHWCTPTDITKTRGKYIDVTERTISAKGLAASSAQLLPPGSILLCTRATIGEMKIAKVSIATNQGFKSLVCKEQVSNEFLYYKLSMEKKRFIEKASGSTFLEISKKDVVELEVEIPDVKEQTAIAQILSDTDAEITALEARRDKTRAIKQGMMQQLLTGRVRLV